jgi:hypothetical protein
MKKTVQAIKYALEELHLTPDKLFQLIESAQGYEGDNYELWLANKIIGVADSEGIPFTELLVKKLKLLSSLRSNEEEGVSEVVDNFIKNVVSDYSFVVDFSGLDLDYLNDSSDFDWFNGLSLVDGTLTEMNDSNYAYVGFLDSAGAGKNEVSLAGKSMGIPITSKGGAMMLRFLLMDDQVEPTGNTYVFISDSAFYKENPQITKEFFNRFSLVDTVYLNKSETMQGSFASGLNLITVWKTYSEEGYDYYETEGMYSESELVIMESNDVIIGRSLIKPNIFPNKYFYADSEILMSDLLKDYLIDSEEEVQVPVINLDLEVEDAYDLPKSDLGAYLSINGTQRVSDFPIAGSTDLIPINKSNLEDLIVYYACSQATEGTWGYGKGLGMILNGLEGYESLVANCLPIFFFGWNSLFHSVEGQVSNFLPNGELAQELYEKYNSFMSFESKVLWTLGTDYSEAMISKSPELKNSTFYQIRSELKDSSFERVYKEKLELALRFVNVQSKGYLC